MDSFVLCVRAALGDRFSTDLGPPAWLAVPPEAAVPGPGHALAGPEAWVAELQAAGRPVVFYVHGYNTDPAEALLRQRRLDRELAARDLPCTVVGFDWPTGGTAAAYLHDRLQAQGAALALVEGAILPFLRARRPDCPTPVHLLAHSMGAFVLREAFRAADQSHRPDLGGPWRVAQVVLVAADLSSDSFRGDHPDMAPVFARCGRLTNHFSGHDQALAVSSLKHLDLASRVGRVGMPAGAPGSARAVDVDCGPRYLAVPDRRLAELDGLVSHSWYLEDPRWHDDLAHTLRGALGRAHFPTRSPVGENDFVLDPG